MSHWILRLGVALTALFTCLFLVAFGLAMHSSSRDQVTKLVERFATTRTPQSSSTAVSEEIKTPMSFDASAHERGFGQQTDIQVKAALQQLAKSAMKARLAMAVDLDAGREIASAGSYSQKAQEIRTRIETEAASNDQAQMDASAALQKLEAQYFTDPDKIERVTRTFASQQKDPAIKAMFGSLLQLRHDPKTEPGRYKSSFGSDGMSIWSRAAYE